jgi:hypothetical protein
LNWTALSIPGLPSTVIGSRRNAKMTLNRWDEIRMIPRLAIADSFHIRQMDLRLRYRIIGVGILRVLG